MLASGIYAEIYQRHDNKNSPNISRFIWLFKDQFESVSQTSHFKEIKWRTGEDFEFPLKSAD